MRACRMQAAAAAPWLATTGKKIIIFNYARVGARAADGACHNLFRSLCARARAMLRNTKRKKAKKNAHKQRVCARRTRDDFVP